jgi:hypothetical protein
VSTTSRLSRTALGWRIAFSALLVGLAVNGSVRGNDVQWPFAPMSQFAFGVNLDGDIRSTSIEADTTAGTTVRVPLTVNGVGLGRAEVEGQLPRFVADPSLLQHIAVAAARRHPDQPRYTRLRLEQEVSDLQDGEVVSTTTVLLATWDVVDPAGLR